MGIGGLYFMRAGYSWIAPLNRSWISQMNNAVDFKPRDAMTVVLGGVVFVDFVPHPSGAAGKW